MDSKQQTVPRHAIVWGGTAAERNHWLEAVVSGFIAVYFVGGLLGAIGLL